MFVGERLIYLAMQKTGSTAIEAKLRSAVGGVLIRKHDPLLSDAGPFYVAGSIRNPWDWYVSLWAYGCKGKGEIFDTLTGADPLRRPVAAARLRPRWWQKTYRDADDVEAFRSWLTRLLSDDVLRKYVDLRWHSRVGLMTHRFLALYTFPFDGGGEPSGVWAERSIADGFIRMEALDEGIELVLEEAGYIDVGNQPRIRMNSSSHRAFAEYYDDDTAALVRRQDDFLVERFEYSLQV